MNMSVEIERVVSDLGKVSINQVLQEAIMNCIQANAKNINIYVDYKTLGGGMPCYVNNMKIIDDGEGFTEQNTQSFSKYKSTHKMQMGAKGIGRFLFLKLFKKVLIKSLDKAITFNLNDVSVKQEDYTVEDTTISFSDANKDVDINLKDIQDNMKEHFLPYFHLMQNKAKITITLHANKKLIFSIDNKDIPILITDSFKLKKHTFSISYILNHYKKAKHNGFYCANGRVVIKNNKDDKSKLKSFKDINILFLVTSSLLDKKVNDTRDDFNIYPKRKKSIFDEISWDDLQDALSEKLLKILRKNGIDIEKKAREELTLAIKKAPYLSSYLTSNEYATKSDELIEKAEKQFNEDKKKIRDNNSTNQQEYQQKVSVTTQAELAEYIFDRQKIIDNLKKITKEDTLESEIHNLFMKKNTQDEQQDYKSNNLWLFDDRFMVYDKIFSDTQIKKIFPDLSKNLDKPDLLSIVSNTYAKDKITDIVIIELKRPNKKITPAGAEAQLLKYARYVNESRKDNKIRIWTYAFLTFDQDVEDALIDKSYNKIPIQNRYPIFYNYYATNNVIINFMDYTALADDADTRNKTFMDILENK